MQADKFQDIKWDLPIKSLKTINRILNWAGSQWIETRPGVIHYVHVFSAFWTIYNRDIKDWGRPRSYIKNYSTIVQS